MVGVILQLETNLSGTPKKNGREALNERKKDIFRTSRRTPLGLGRNLRVDWLRKTPWIS